MKRTYIILICILITKFCFAWNARGHMIVAALAYYELNLDQKERITELLKFHPDYSKIWSKEYKRVRNNVELGQYLIMRASIWPDEIRNRDNKSFKFHRPEWHYVTYKIDFNNGHDSNKINGDQEPNIVWAISHSKLMIENTKLDHSVRAMYLAWLIHLIGDIHQPLHCASLFNSSYPKGDRGGNKFFVKPNKAGVKLHHLWDYALGSRGKRHEDKIRNQAVEIRAAYKSDIQKLDLEKFNPFDWSIESFNLAVSDVHLNGTLKGSKIKESAPLLPINYTKNMKKLTEKRVLFAGMRLGSTLNNINVPSNYYNHDDD